MKKMQDQMQGRMNQQQQNHDDTPPVPKQNNIKEGDYIDFEEVKDSH